MSDHHAQQHARHQAWIEDINKKTQAHGHTSARQRIALFMNHLAANSRQLLADHKAGKVTDADVEAAIAFNESKDAQDGAATFILG